MAINRKRPKKAKLPPPSRRARDVPPDPLSSIRERIEALTPEDMLDTSIEDARTAENFRFAEQLHAEALARGDKDAIELERLAKQAEKDLARRRRQAPETGPEQ